MPQTKSKAEIVRKLLSRGKGATLPEISKATTWQPHSCRAFLTGIRKTEVLVKEQRPDGALAYRLTPAPELPPKNGRKPPEEDAVAQQVPSEAAASEVSQ